MLAVAKAAGGCRRGPWAWRARVRVDCRMRDRRPRRARRPRGRHFDCGGGAVPWLSTCVGGVTYLFGYL